MQGNFSLLDLSSILLLNQSYRCTVLLFNVKNRLTFGPILLWCTHPGTETCEMLALSLPAVLL